MNEIINKLKNGNYINNREFLNIANSFNIKINMHTQIFILNKVKRVSNKYIVWNSQNHSKCLFNIYKEVMNKVNEL